jgi:hypothetical protein
MAPPSYPGPECSRFPVRMRFSRITLLARNADGTLTEAMPVSRCVLCLAFVACGHGDNPGPSRTLPPELTDTTGEKFSFQGSDGGLSFELVPGRAELMPVSCQTGAGPEVFIVNPAHNVVIIEAVRLLSTTLINGQAQPSFNEPAELMHPVRCTTSSQCPLSVCKNGLCRTTALPMSTVDVLALCFADLPWPADCATLYTGTYSARLSEVIAACPSSTSGGCASVPQDCRQP